MRLLLLALALLGLYSQVESKKISLLHIVSKICRKNHCPWKMFKESNLLKGKWTCGTDQMNAVFDIMPSARESALLEYQKSNPGMPLNPMQVVSQVFTPGIYQPNVYGYTGGMNRWPKRLAKIQQLMHGNMGYPGTSPAQYGNMASPYGGSIPQYGGFVGGFAADPVNLQGLVRTAQYLYPQAQLGLLIECSASMTNTAMVNGMRVPPLIRIWPANPGHSQIQYSNSWPGGVQHQQNIYVNSNGHSYVDPSVLTPGAQHMPTYSPYTQPGYGGQPSSGSYYSSTTTMTSYPRSYK
jgi:hypothetical protein